MHCNDHTGSVHTSHHGPGPSFGPKRSGAIPSIRLFIILQLVMTGVAILARDAGAGSIVFDYVNSPPRQNGYTVSGTMTVSLPLYYFETQDDIISWSITVSLNGVTQWTLTPANSHLTCDLYTLSYAGGIYFLAVGRYPAVFGNFTLQSTSEQDSLTWTTFPNYTLQYTATANGAALWITDDYDVAQFTATSFQIPEPASYAQLAVGAAGLALLIAHRRSRQRRYHQRHGNP